MKLAYVLAAFSLALAAACSQPAATTATTEAPSPDASRAAVLDVLTPALATDIGQPVTLDVTSLNVDNDWAFAVVQPKAATGADLDWSTTKYAQRAADGVLDGNGTTYALLQRVNGAWTVKDFVVGPTDVAYADWAGRYGAPESLFGQ